MFPGIGTQMENIHLVADGSLSAPQVFGCPCGHFTIVGRPEHIERFAN